MHHEARFLPTHPCVRARGVQMPFGKNKRLAPRAKKKAKVEAREEALDAAQEKASAEEEAEVRSPLRSIAPAEVPAGPSPGRQKRMQAEVELDELLAEYEVRQEMDDKAEKELALAERLYDAKMRRIDASQAGKRHGKPFGELSASIRRRWSCCARAWCAQRVRGEHTMQRPTGWPSSAACCASRTRSCSAYISCTRESTVTGDKSDVLESQPVILSVLSVPNHARITWYQWFRASRSSKNHRTTL